MPEEGETDDDAGYDDEGDPVDAVFGGPAPEAGAVGLENLGGDEDVVPEEPSAVDEEEVGEQDVDEDEDDVA